jgi:ketosteroid isomerase-like protein
VRSRLLLLAGATLALVACHGKSEEAKIHALLAKSSAAVEDSDVRGVTDLLSDDFKAGELDRQSVKGYLAARLLRGEKVTVVRREESIKVDGDKATASFDVGLFSGDRTKIKGVIPSRMGTYRFTLTLAKIDGEWKVTRADYRDLPPAQFAIEIQDF